MPIATGLESTSGSGHPHMECPMEQYISGSRKMSDAIRRFRMAPVSGLPSLVFLCSFKFLSSIKAPYPAFSTARMTSSGFAVPMTVMELVKRLTLTSSTLFNFRTALSTLLLQAAQLMPVTQYLSMRNLSPKQIYTSIMI